MRWIPLACLVWLGAFMTTPNANEVAILGCQNAAASRVRAMRPAPDDIKFAPGPRVTAMSNRAKRIDGAGVYQDRAMREWHRFTYSCTYNERSREARAKVRIDGATAATARHPSKRRDP